VAAIGLEVLDEARVGHETSESKRLNAGTRWPTTPSGHPR